MYFYNIQGRLNDQYEFAVLFFTAPEEFKTFIERLCAQFKISAVVFVVRSTLITANSNEYIALYRFDLCRYRRKRQCYDLRSPLVPFIPPTGCSRGASDSHVAQWGKWAEWVKGWRMIFRGWNKSGRGWRHKTLLHQPALATAWSGTPLAIKSSARNKVVEWRTVFSQSVANVSCCVFHPPMHVHEPHSSHPPYRDRSL